MKFTIPFNCRVVGIRNYAGTSPSVGDLNVGFYDSSGTAVGTPTAYEGDIVGGGGPSNYLFTTPVTLTAGTYRVGIEPTTTTNANVTTVTVPSSDYMIATPGGTAVVYSAFATSSWTDSTTQYPLMDLIIDQVDNGAGSGGGGGRIIGG